MTLYKLQKKEWVILAKLFGSKKAQECRDIIVDTDKRVEVVSEILNEEFKQRIRTFGELNVNEEDRRRRDLSIRTRHIQCRACFGKSDPVSLQHKYDLISYKYVFLD